MKRIIIVRAHIASTFVAAIAIVTFFTFSLAAEIKGDEEYIKEVKEGIFLWLPVMLVAMPILNITGNKLGGQSNHSIVETKRKRMKIVLLNGICLISLACFLYYWSHHMGVDGTFLTAQITEFVLGLTNLTLIGLNVRSGLKLSGRFKPQTR